MTYQGVLHRYGRLLDLPSYTQTISLLEGDTPLILLPRLGKELDCDLYVKFEGLNPTGSFKDRGMTAAISEAVGRSAMGPGASRFAGRLQTGMRLRTQ